MTHYKIEMSSIEGDNVLLHLICVEDNAFFGFHHLDSIGCCLLIGANM